MVVDTKGTQHLLLFWQRPQIFGRYNFRETHGPSLILDDPIRCIFRHSCPFCLHWCLCVWYGWPVMLRDVIERCRWINIRKINIMLHQWRCWSRVQLFSIRSFVCSNFLFFFLFFLLILSLFYNWIVSFSLVRDKNEIKRKRGDLPERDVYVEREHYYSCDRFSQSHF